MITALSNFLNAHFEVLLAINAFFYIGLFVLFAAARLRSFFFAGMLNKVFFVLLCGLQAALMVLTLTAVFINLGTKPALDFSAQIIATTKWVKEDETVFFIDEDKLMSVQVSGDKRQVVFQATDRIRQYVFSPDGRYLLIVTEKDLLLFNRKERTVQPVVSLKLATGQLNGVIGEIQWARDSRRFCFRLSQWSEIASVDQWWVYDVFDQEKRPVRNPGVILTSLVWGWQGDRLYGYRFREISSSSKEVLYEFDLFVLAFPHLRPEKILSLNTSSLSLPEQKIAREGIRLYVPSKQYAFGFSGQKRTTAYSLRGAVIGIDDLDMLYYTRMWWRKRLYKVPRVAAFSDMPRYQYRGGQLTINDLRFLPSGRYVIMEHYFWGILILDPVNGRVGILDNQHGSTFGWYPG